MTANLSRVAGARHGMGAHPQVDVAYRFYEQTSPSGCEIEEAIQVGQDELATLEGRVGHPEHPRRAHGRFVGSYGSRLRRWLSRSFHRGTARELVAFCSSKT
ncbi:MAG: hypothetical protein IPL28_17110 [Chloroflexi bacterium]|nr:hypothetical protein [Chloroflexota bacterium]